MDKDPKLIILIYIIVLVVGFTFCNSENEPKDTKPGYNDEAIFYCDAYVSFQSECSVFEFGCHLDDVDMDVTIDGYSYERAYAINQGSRISLSGIHVNTQ